MVDPVLTAVVLEAINKKNIAHEAERQPATLKQNFCRYIFMGFLIAIIIAIIVGSFFIISKFMIPIFFLKFNSNFNNLI